jgi:hypothetical protein
MKACGSGGVAKKNEKPRFEYCGPCGHLVEVIIPTFVWPRVYLYMGNSEIVYLCNVIRGPRGYDYIMDVVCVFM